MLAFWLIDQPSCPGNFPKGAQERVLPRDRVQRLQTATRSLRDAWIRQQTMRTGLDPGIHLNQTIAGPRHSTAFDSHRPEPAHGRWVYANALTCSQRRIDMKKYVIVAFAASALLASPTLAQRVLNPGEGGGQGYKTTHDNPSQCMGLERGARNSSGGDREKGAFGPAQSEFVAMFNDADGWTDPTTGETYYSYGEWLQAWKAANC